VQIDGRQYIFDYFGLHGMLLSHLIAFEKDNWDTIMWKLRPIPPPRPLNPSSSPITMNPSVSERPQYHSHIVFRKCQFNQPSDLFSLSLVSVTASEPYLNLLDGCLLDTEPCGRSLASSLIWAKKIWARLDRPRTGHVAVCPISRTVGGGWSISHK
jgi:hypothetical protein